MLVFGFLQGSAVKPKLWTFLSVIYCFFAQQPKIRVFKGVPFQNPGFQFPVSKTNWYFIFQVKLENGNSRFTLKSPFTLLFEFLSALTAFKLTTRYYWFWDFCLYSAKYSWWILNTQPKILSKTRIYSWPITYYVKSPHRHTWLDKIPLVHLKQKLEIQICW